MTGSVRRSVGRLARHLLAVLGLGLALLAAAPGPVRADPDFDLALRDLSGLAGRTIVGVRPQGDIWSAYFDPGGRVDFLYSTGARRSGSWYGLTADAVCFRFADPPQAEVCKRVQPAGRGLDWITVGETEPSSQIILRWQGPTEADQASYRPTLRDWWNTIIVGRIRGSRNIWYAVLWPDSTFSFLYSSGTKARGVYFLYDSAICFKFDSDEETFCREPQLADGSIRWVDPGGAESISDIVYLHRLPQPAMAASQSGGGSAAAWSSARTSGCSAGQRLGLQVACVVAALGEYGCSTGLTAYIPPSELSDAGASALCSGVAQQMTAGEIDLGVLGLNAFIGAMDGAGQQLMNQDGASYLMGVLLRSTALAGNLALIGQCLNNVGSVCR